MPSPPLAMPFDAEILGPVLDSICSTALPAGWRKTLCYKVVELMPAPMQRHEDSATDEVLNHFEELQALARRLGESNVAGLT